VRLLPLVSLMQRVNSRLHFEFLRETVPIGSVSNPSPYGGVGVALRDRIEWCGCVAQVGTAVDAVAAVGFAMIRVCVAVTRCSRIFFAAFRQMSSMAVLGLDDRYKWTESLGADNKYWSRTRFSRFWRALRCSVL